MTSTIKWLAFASIVLFTSCSKDNDNIPAPGTGSSFLSIKLNQGYLSSTQVDSAIATWKLNGIEQRVKLKPSHDSLLADIKLFREGTGELTLQIFSDKKYYNSYKGEFISKKIITLQNDHEKDISGPVSFFDTAWLPRVLLKDGIGHEALIGLRPDDPYFIIKDFRHDYYKLVVDRGYWKAKGGISFAGGGVWECSSGCTNSENNEYFRILPGRIGSNPWDHISITILIQTNASGEAWVLNLEHDTD